MFKVLDIERGFDMKDMLTSTIMIIVYHLMLGYIYNYLSGFTNFRKELNEKVHDETAYRASHQLVSNIIDGFVCVFWPFLLVGDLLRLLETLTKGLKP